MPVEAVFFCIYPASGCCFEGIVFTDGVGKLVPEYLLPCGDAPEGLDAEHDICALSQLALGLEADIALPASASKQLSVYSKFMPSDWFICLTRLLSICVYQFEPAQPKPMAAPIMSMMSATMRMMMSSFVDSISRASYLALSLFGRTIL